MEKEGLEKQNKEVLIGLILALESIKKENEYQIQDLKDKLKQAKEYIEENMEINDNPTLYTEEDFYKSLPMWLTLEDEELRKLLEMLEV